MIKKQTMNQIIYCRINRKLQTMQYGKMFNNLPENEHLHSPLEENTLDYQSDTPPYPITHTKLHRSFHQLPKKMKALVAAASILAFVLLAVAWNHYTTLPYLEHKLFMLKENDLLEQRLPKILWIYTQNQRDAEQMQNDIYYNYFANQAKIANYEIRKVNSLTAYDYLDQQTTKNITVTMNKRRVDETVHSFLKLALLLQNGGLLITPGTILLDNNFRWVQSMFDKYSHEQDNYNCQPQKSSLFISQHAATYDARIMAAVPQNPFLRQLLAFMSEVVVSEQLQKQNAMSQKFNISGLTWNPTVRVYSFKDSISNCINHLLKITNKQKEQCYAGIQSAKTNLTLLVDAERHSSRYFDTDKQDIINRLLIQNGIMYRNEVKALIGFNTNKINTILTDLALGKYSADSLKDSFMYPLLQAPGNKEVFLEELPQRDIELCLVIMEPLNKQQLIYTSTLFNEQTYRNWRLIMPAADIKNAPQFSDYRIAVIQAKSTKVHNIEKAVTKHCPHLGYAVVLNFNQTFENLSALHSIAKAAQPRQVVGVYIPLKSNTESHYVRSSYTRFYRFDDGIVKPKLDMMKHMINHFRVFSVETFKTIPQFAMRDWNSKYYKDRLIFLMDFHDLIHREINQPEQLYVIKKNANIWNIPTKISILEDVAVLNVNELEEVDQAQLKITRPRVSSRNIKYILYDLNRYKVPMSKMVAFNPGDDFVPVEQKTGPQIIPRIVHQVWIGSQIPPAKQYFIQKTRKLYSSYQIKVWRDENITRELFPNTYDLIKTLMEFNKGSPYNKLATVTDIMRHEILYREGGLWKDAGMNMLRPIPDAFLRYKLILSTDRLFQYRYLQGMCFFGNMPQYQNLQRINNYRNLNRMRIHSSDPLSIAGPVDFRQLLIGQEEFDPEIILMPYQAVYPGQVGQHPDGDLCTTKQLKRNQKYEILEGGWYLLPGCEEKYPYAFAIEHNNYGSSWVGAKQLVKK